MPPLVKKFNDHLTGWPDKGLTVLLVAISILIMVVALRGKPYAKAIVAAWLIAP
jgi:hypothetical protein